MPAAVLPDLRARHLSRPAIRDGARAVAGPSSGIAHTTSPESTSHLGRVVFLQGEPRQGRALLHSTFRLIREAKLAGDTLADGLDWLAAVEGARGEPARAARSFGAAEREWRASGAIRYAPDRVAYEREVAAVRSVLGDAAFGELWSKVWR